MNINEYSKEAMRTDFADYSDFHTGSVSARLDYASIGMVTEVSKVLDIVKKSKKNLQKLDEEKVVEELGDLLWYLNIALNELGISFSDIMESNLRKIERRYPSSEGNMKGLIRGE